MELRSNGELPMTALTRIRILSLTVIFLWSVVGIVRGAEPALGFQTNPSGVNLLADGEVVTAYVFADEKIPRPYFAHVRLPGGPQLTRNHPPKEGDAQDHDLLHPGIWFALGDINGNDNWRLKAPVRGGEFIEQPAVKEGTGTFVVRNRYFANDGQEQLLIEDCRYSFVVCPTGLLLMIDSQLTADVDCRFGDGMEEMGLGVRLATPLAVKSGMGGEIVNSEGRQGEGATRERLVDWCDYHGTIAGRRVGVTIFASPENSRKTWWHNRDYGFFAANAFHAHPDRPDNTPIILKKGESVRLRYGVALHGDTPTATYDPTAEYQAYTERSAGK